MCIDSQKRRRPPGSPPAAANRQGGRTMNTPLITRTHSSYDYDVRKAVATHVNLGELAELFIWCVGLLAVVVVAALLVS